MPMPSEVEMKDSEVPPDPKLDQPQRRRFNAEQKRRILEELDACTERGQIGAVLRREGLYASQVASWRQQRAAEGLAGLEPQKVGRKPRHDPKDRQIAQLERDKARLEAELEISRKLIALQKKAFAIYDLLPNGEPK